MNAEGSSRRDSFWTCLLASGLLGAAIGICFPTAQVAIEPAQVLAGLVSYPPDNPFGLYQRNVWTLWHQILAPLLAVGVGERALCFAISAVVGALSFAALAVFAWACGASLLVALLAPLFLWMLGPIRWGFNYPILLLGSPHTYGMAGLAWMVLAVAVLGAGHARLGSFLLGVAPAVHASLGLWTGIATLGCLLVDWRRTREQLPDLLRGGTLGLGVAGLSLAIHLAGRPAQPEISAADLYRHWEAYIRDWDGHRRDVALADRNGLMLAVGAAIALQGIVRAGFVSSLLPYRVHLASALLGVAFVLLHRDVPAGALPAPLLAAMPTRVLNLPMIAFVPMLMAAFWLCRGRAIARWAILVLGAAALLRYRAPDAVHLLVIGLGMLAATLLALPKPAIDRPPSRTGAALERAARVGLALTVGLALGATAWGAPKRAARLLDRGNEPVLAAASRGTGLLLVAPGLRFVQLATRRAIVLDPAAIDMLPYAPAGGPAVARIVGEIYGIDFFSPPRSTRNLASIVAEPVRPVWERRDGAQWAELARRFGFTEVIAPPDWVLSLPVVERSDTAVLYRVP